MLEGGLRIHQAGSREPADVRELYFAFPSGRLSYDCVTCGARCCRGHGYVCGNHEELSRHLGLRPGLAAFVELRRASVRAPLQMGNLPDGCFFLTSEGLCDIHATHGEDEKPETCRLFPFNNLRLCGETLIVAPHPSLCPLIVLTGEERSRRSAHESLAEALSAKGVAAEVERCEPKGSTPDAFIALERAVVRAANDTLARRGSFLELASEQMALGRASSTTASTLAGSQIDASESEEIVRALEDAAELFDVEVGVLSAGDREVEDVMIAATPFLRVALGLRYVRDDGSGDDSECLSPTELPRALVGLYALALLAKRTGMQHVTFLTVARLLETFRPTLQLLVTFRRVMAWLPNVVLRLPTFARAELRAPYMCVAKALLSRQQRRSRTPLGELLRPILRTEGADRAILLRLVASSTFTKLVGIDEARRSQSNVSLRASVQQTALGMRSMDTIEKLYDLAGLSRD